MSKPASLSAGLIAKKGEAAPVATVIQPVSPAAPVAAAPQPIPPASAPTPAALPAPKGANTNTIAVTVRLDPDRYQALKLYGVKTRTSNQDVLVAALDQYLSSRTE
jgi:hypothetical protein